MNEHMNGKKYEKISPYNRDFGMQQQISNDH